MKPTYDIQVTLTKDEIELLRKAVSNLITDTEVTEVLTLHLKIANALIDARYYKGE